MQDRSKSTNAIPFEILRRQDGAIALSCSAGLLGRPPQKALIRGEDLVLEDAAGVELALLPNMAGDVFEHFTRQPQIPFFESLRTGILQAHWITLRASS